MGRRKGKKRGQARDRRQENHSVRFGLLCPQRFLDQGQLVEFLDAELLYSETERRVSADQHLVEEQITSPDASVANDIDNCACGADRVDLAAIVRAGRVAEVPESSMIQVSFPLPVACCKVNGISTTSTPESLLSIIHFVPGAGCVSGRPAPQDAVLNHESVVPCAIKKSVLAGASTGQR